MLAEELETVLDHSRVRNWLPADRALQTFDDGLDVGDMASLHLSCDQAGFPTNLSQNVVMELLVSLIHDVHLLLSF